MLDPSAAVEGFVDSFLDTVNPLNDWLSVPDIGPRFGHETADAAGWVVATLLVKIIRPPLCW